MIELNVESVIETLASAQAFWAYIFLFALIDSTFAVGVVLSGLGTLAIATFGYTQGIIGLPEIAITAFFGAYLGDTLSFGFGRICAAGLAKRGHVSAQHALTQKPTKLQVGVQKAQNGLARFGPLFFIVGRWLPIASLLPASYAVLGVPLRRFLALDALACLIWVVGWCVIIFLGVKGVSVFA